MADLTITVPDDQVTRVRAKMGKYLGTVDIIQPTQQAIDDAKAAGAAPPQPTRVARPANATEIRQFLAQRLKDAVQSVEANEAHDAALSASTAAIVPLNVA